MWEQVARARRRRHDRRRRRSCERARRRADVVYCQSWQYDDPVGAARRARSASTRATGSTPASAARRPQVLVQDLATRDPAPASSTWPLVVGAEALDTQAAFKKRGERCPCYVHEPADKRPFPFEAPFHPAEVAHEVFQAWLTFAVFDIARRAHLGVGARRLPRAARRAVGAVDRRSRPRNPSAWFPVARDADEIIDRPPRQPHGRLPVHEVHDLDHGRRHGRRGRAREPRDGRRARCPADRRVYLRGWCYATDPVLRRRAPRPDGAHRRWRRRAARRSRARASASTTSRTSISTRCFPAR